MENIIEEIKICMVLAAIIGALIGCFLAKSDCENNKSNMMQ